MVKLYGLATASKDMAPPVHGKDRAAAVAAEAYKVWTRRMSVGRRWLLY